MVYQVILNVLLVIYIIIYNNAYKSSHRRYCGLMVLEETFGLGIHYKKCNSIYQTIYLKQRKSKYLHGL